MIQSSRDISRLTAIWIMSALLLMAAFISLYHIQRDSLWYDEGFTAYIVHDDVPAPHNLRESVHYVLDSALNTFQRARTDVHPLLYYGLMDGWTLIMGESVLILRLPAFFFALIALCATYALGSSLFDRRTALIAVLLLAVAHFFVYYSREARMYTLLVALASLSMLAYVRWIKRATRRRAMVYGLSMGLLLHTHYIGALIIFAQACHQIYLAVRYRKLQAGQLILAYAIAFAVFLPFLPLAIEQFRGHPMGPLGGALSPAQWGTVTWIWDVITSSQGGLYGLAFLLGGAGVLIWRQARMQDHLLLLLLWAGLIPLALFAINALGSAVLVMRYLLVILPAISLISAFGIRHLTSTPALIARLPLRHFAAGLSLMILIGICVAQLTTYPYYWGDKPRWDEAVAQAAQTRTSLQPALVDLPPHNVATYYDRQFHVRRGISIDIGWRDFVPEEVASIIEKLQAAPSIWAILPSDAPQTWYALFDLRQGRDIAYRDSVQNMIFYRFDQTDKSHLAPLDLGFYAAGQGRLLDYQGGIGHHWYAQSGADFCFDVLADVLQDIRSDYRWQASITQGFDTQRAQVTQALDQASTGDSIKQNLCISLPADAPRGPYLLRLALLDASGAAQPVVESQSDLFFGYYMGLAWVSVDMPESS